MAVFRHVPVNCRGPCLFAVIYQHRAALGTLDETDTRCHRRQLTTYPTTYSLGLL